MCTAFDCPWPDRERAKRVKIGQMHSATSIEYYSAVPTITAGGDKGGVEIGRGGSAVVGAVALRMTIRGAAGSVGAVALRRVIRGGGGGRERLETVGSGGAVA
jgi:hypothetical protein